MERYSIAKGASANMTVTCSTLTLADGVCPLVKMSGSIPSGTRGNGDVASAFIEMSKRIDLMEAEIRFVVYDCATLQYTSGDHVAGFFWVPTALLDSVAIVVVAHGATLWNLKSLASFVGMWLPIEFFESLDEVVAGCVTGRKAYEALLAKRDACCQSVFGSKSDPSTIAVVPGSRRIAVQYQEGTQYTGEPDLDLGAVGSPRNLAVLVSERPPIAVVQHPAARLVSSTEQAVREGNLVVHPQS